jgi:hypothetical protein
VRRVLLVLIFAMIFVAKPASAEPKPNKLLVVGLALAASGYALSALKPLDCAAHGRPAPNAPFCDASPWLLVPLAGHPAYLIASHDERVPNPGPLHQAVLALGWAPFLMQWAGLGLATLGWTAAPMVTPSSAEVRLGRVF